MPPLFFMSIAIDKRYLIYNRMSTLYVRLALYEKLNITPYITPVAWGFPRRSSRDFRHFITG